VPNARDGSHGGVAVGRRDISPDILNGIHILIVDDDLMRRELVRMALQRGGALVTEVDSPDAAWHSLDRITPEVILWAIAFGGGETSAPAVVQRVNANPRRPRAIPIVAVVGQDPVLPMDEVLGAGFAGYVRAPFEAGHLCAMLADVVETQPE
jgi:CheY-like chemotaxis protein